MNIKFSYLFLIVLLFSTASRAQKVGVGTTSPEYDLDVNGRMRLKLTNNETSRIIINNISNQAICNIWHNDDDHVGFYSPATGIWNMVMNVNNGFIGMGTVTPTFKLDLKGRMRIQHDTSTAGIWLDGVSLPTRSFVGTKDNDHVGFFGNAGAGWDFVMNVNNGNVGMGTSTPTAELDVNGDVRLRSNFPVKGSTLISTNTSGNAAWVNPNAFKAAGTLNNVPFPISDQTWTKVFFNTNTNYKVGLGYTASDSEYNVTIQGLYNFKTAFSFLETAGSQSVRIRLKRNNVVSTIGEMYYQRLWWYQDENTNGFGNFRDIENLSVMASLLPGDAVWVEAFIELAGSGGADTQISNDPTRTWFTGKLIARL